jgi:hypothetical protein
LESILPDYSISCLCEAAEGVRPVEYGRQVSVGGMKRVVCGRW